MVRTTPQAVEGLVEFDPTVAVAPFIETASSVVDARCLDSGYDSVKLELIERWLSAHFYSIRVQTVASEKADDIQVSYQYRVDLHFNQTKYGQMALLIDDAGNLAALQEEASSGGKTKATLHWLGTVRC